MYSVLVSVLFGKEFLRIGAAALYLHAQEEDGFLSMNSLYGSVRLSQDSDNVIILQDQELMNEMRSHDSGSYRRDARPSPLSPYQNPSKFVQVELNSIHREQYTYCIAEYNYLNNHIVHLYTVPYL